MYAVPNLTFFYGVSWYRTFQVRFSDIFLMISRLFQLPLLSLV